MKNDLIPTQAFLTRGVGRHRYWLKSFEEALRNAGVAIPKDITQWGYLSEVRGHGMNHQQASDMAEDLAANMLGTTLGLEVDPDHAWSEKEQVYKASGLIIRTSNITQTAQGQKDLWTTCVAVAGLLFD